MKHYSMSKTCKILGIHRNTLMQWEEKDKIPKAKRNPKNNYRIYTPQDILMIAHLMGIEYLNKDGAD